MSCWDKARHMSGVMSCWDKARHMSGVMSCWDKARHMSGVMLRHRFAEVKHLREHRDAEPDKARHIESKSSRENWFRVKGGSEEYDSYTEGIKMHTQTHVCIMKSIVCYVVLVMVHTMVVLWSDLTNLEVLKFKFFILLAYKHNVGCCHLYCRSAKHLICECDNNTTG